MEKEFTYFQQIILIAFREKDKQASFPKALKQRLS